jgi:hypothetical protein
MVLFQRVRVEQLISAFYSGFVNDCGHLKFADNLSNGWVFVAEHQAFQLGGCRFWNGIRNNEALSTVHAYNSAGLPCLPLKAMNGIEWTGFPE